MPDYHVPNLNQYIQANGSASLALHEFLTDMAAFVKSQGASGQQKVLETTFNAAVEVLQAQINSLVSALDGKWLATTFIQIAPDETGSNTTHTFTHNLNTTDLLWAVNDASGPNDITTVTVGPVKIVIQTSAAVTSETFLMRIAHMEQLDLG